MQNLAIRRGVWATCLLAISVLIAAPAGAAQIDVPLDIASGHVQYKSSGGLSADGISETGNLLLGDLAFSIPDISSTQANAILGGSSPVLATLTLDGAASGQTAQITVSNTFTDLSTVATFFTPAADNTTVLNFATGTITGAFDANLSDISVNAHNRGFGESTGAGSNQLTSGIGNLLGNTDNFFDDIQNDQYDLTGTGTLNLQQVGVPEPGHIALLGLALLGLGLIWRRKQPIPRA